MTITVRNMFNGMQVPVSAAIRMIAAGRAKYIDDRTIEFTFLDLDMAVASDKGSAATHRCGGRATVAVSGWDGNDPNKGSPAVMLRGNDGGPVSYY